MCFVVVCCLLYDVCHVWLVVCCLLLLVRRCVLLLDCG